MCAVKRSSYAFLGLVDSGPEVAPNVSGLLLGVIAAPPTLLARASPQHISRSPSLRVELSSFCASQGAPTDGRFRVAFPPDLEGPWPELRFSPRWCSLCASWKPPRAHHSRRVGRCVLRMDHYCVVAQNIVGARNHGHFMLMVVFGILGLLWAHWAPHLGVGQIFDST